MNHSQLKKNLTQCKNQRIFVIGDIMLDEFHWCSVARISPEAPVPICKINSTTLVPGGAANVAHNIHVLGSHVRLGGTLGQDSSGDKLISILNKQNIDTSSIVKSSIKPTILKSRIIAHQQHVVRVDRENDEDIDKTTQKAILQELTLHLPTIDAILLSDYLKGTLCPSLTKTIIQLAATHKKIVIVDPKGNDYSKYKGATILTPNFKEFLAVVGKDISKEKDIEIEGKRLIKKLQLNALLVTRSEKGMSLITEKEKIDIPTQAKEVYDITGAGDTVIAMLTICLAAGLPQHDAAYLANFAAGIVVGKRGTATTTLDEIKATL